MQGELSTAADLECDVVEFEEARPISFVTITHKREIFERDLAASPLFAAGRHELIAIENPRSAAIGLNDGLARAINEVVAFVHHDVWLPPTFETQLEYALRGVEARDPNWGVLGVAGARLEAERLAYHGSIFDGIGRRRWGYPWLLHAEVDTLDELMLIVRHGANPRFDETLPGFHAYGPQLCLAARAAGMRNYAILAECEHRSESSGWSPDLAYFINHAYVAQRWSRAQYAAMFGPMPAALPSPMKERVYEGYERAKAGVGYSAGHAAHAIQRVSGVSAS